jgi:hypothetical protein
LGYPHDHENLMSFPIDPPRAAANPAYYFGASGVSALAFFPLWKVRGPRRRRLKPSFCDIQLGRNRPIAHLLNDGFTPNDGCLLKLS